MSIKIKVLQFSLGQVLHIAMVAGKKKQKNNTSPTSSLEVLAPKLFLEVSYDILSPRGFDEFF